MDLISRGQNGEFEMIVEIATEDYTDLKNIDNVTNLSFQDTVNPLYVGTRIGQVERMKEKMHREKLFGKAIGVWEIKSFLNKDGTLNAKKFGDFDGVFFSDPSRVHESIREQYELLIIDVTAKCS